MSTWPRNVWCVTATWLSDGRSWVLTLLALWAVALLASTVAVGWDEGRGCAVVVGRPLPGYGEGRPRAALDSGARGHRRRGA